MRTLRCRNILIHSIVSETNQIFVIEQAAGCRLLTTNSAFVMYEYVDLHNIIPETNQIFVATIVLEWAAVCWQPTCRECLLWLC